MGLVHWRGLLSTGPLVICITSYVCIDLILVVRGSNILVYNHGFHCLIASCIQQAQGQVVE